MYIGAGDGVRVEKGCSLDCRPGLCYDNSGKTDAFINQFWWTTVKYVVGIAGSTIESIAAVISEAGEFLGASHGEGLNLLELRLVDFYRALSSLIDGLIQIANLPRAEGLAGSVLCCSIEGVYSDYDKDMLTKCLRDTALRDCDFRILEQRGISAYLATFGDRRGDAILLKCGTSAFAFALDENERILRSGGWGPYSGDDGGGFSIGRNALARVFCEYDGRLPRSRFGEEFCRRVGTTSALELIRWLGNIRERDVLKTSISDLAIVVASAANRDKDPVAFGLLDSAADKMLESLEAVSRNLTKPEPLVISLQGGLLQNSPALYSAVSGRIEKRWPQATAVRCKYRPVVGTLIRGLEILGLRLVRSHMLTSIDNASDEHLPLLRAHYVSEIEKEAEECRPQL